MYFSERNLTNDTSTWIGFPSDLSGPCLPYPSPAIAPWIALISCDSNSTDASATDDTFTLARDRGAVAAVGSVSTAFVPPVTHSVLIQLLYSTHSAVCMINKEYADPANFNPPFDVFSTQSLTTARSVVDTPLTFKIDPGTGQSKNALITLTRISTGTSTLSTSTSRLMRSITRSMVVTLPA